MLHINISVTPCFPKPYQIQKKKSPPKNPNGWTARMKMPELTEKKGKLVETHQVSGWKINIMTWNHPPTVDGSEILRAPVIIER